MNLEEIEVVLLFLVHDFASFLEEDLVVDPNFAGMEDIVDVEPHDLAFCDQHIDLKLFK